MSVNLRKNKNFKIIILSILFLRVFLFPQNLVFSQKEIKILNIRYSSELEKTRIVFDLEKIPSYSVYFQKTPPRIFLEAPFLKFSEELKFPFFIKDRVVKEINYQNFILDSSNYLRIIIELNYYVPFEYFNLENPSRIVFDFQKIFEIRYISYFKEGIKLEEIKKGTNLGPLSINILKFDLNNKNIKIKPVISGNDFSEMDVLSSIVAKNSAFAGINGGYFAKNGQPLSLVCISGKVITENILNRTCLGITEDGEIVIDNLVFKGNIISSKGEIFKIDGINRKRMNNEVILFTPEFGKETMTNTKGKEFIVEEDTIVEIRDGNSPIPKNGVVISAGESISDLLYANFSVGDRISLNLKVETKEGKKIKDALGGGPRLVKEGKIFITSSEENFKPDIAASRAPRTSVGLTKNKELLITVIDGRQPNLSIGMTLEEMAEFLIKEEVIEALNFDGGGSSTLVVDGKVLNSPSDGKERKISSALLIFLNN
jgi:exopolysaccharide biosynthesis protein